ncbi:MAG: aminodeoxychorismate synthase, component I, partial [Methyloceanibacter sp.]|nr:aminodeoxychorismate synthase, component I [Methyloceanibacter sp.]
MTDSPYVLLDDSLTPAGRSLLYTDPERVVAAYAPDEVAGALDQVEAGLAQGLHAAGFFAYELGYCLEPKLRRLVPEGRRVPLLW